MDLRAYGRLNGAYFKTELQGDVFPNALPIPLSEANARLGNLTVTCN